MEPDLGQLEKAIKEYEKALDQLKNLIKNKPVSHSRLSASIIRHFSKLQSFYQHRQEQTKKSDTTELDTLKDSILIVLLTRSKLQTLLMSDAILMRDGEKSLEIIKQINHLDSDLKKLEELIAQYGDLERLQKLLKRDPEFWSCFHSITHPHDKFDWMWNGFSIIFSITSLALFTNIVPRFFVGGGDLFGTIIIAIPSTLSLLGIQGSLTTVWQKKIEEVLEIIGIAKHWQQEVRCCIAFGILAMSLFSYAMLPSLSKDYNQAGLNALDGGQAQDNKDQFKAKNTIIPEKNFQRAIALYPSNANAYYNLGRLYESIQSLDKARSNYQLAAQYGVTQAYNNLGRLEILDKKYANAVLILSEGIKASKVDEYADIPVKYSLYKNLGWARLKQERYQEAQKAFEEAFKIKLERAAAHCLMAQMLEVQNQKKKARDKWNTCLKYTEQELNSYADNSTQNRFPLDEDQWKYQAQKCLKLDFLKKSCLEKKENLSEDKQ